MPNTSSWLSTNLQTTVSISLVNQPYFSCAHISQSAHAHDEGAGKIRLAKPARVQEPERNVAAKIN